MGTSAFRGAAYSVAVALVIASIAAACGLNPQPIPPGDQPDGSAGGANSSFADGDSGTKSSEDAGHMGTEAGSETGAPPIFDGGTDASDATDAGDAADARDD